MRVDSAAADVPVKSHSDRKTPNNSRDLAVRCLTGWRTGALGF